MQLIIGVILAYAGVKVCFAGVKLIVGSLKTFFDGASKSK